MIPIISYDDDMPDDWDDSMTDALTRICENIIQKYGTIAKYGFFGTWDGPMYGGTLIDDSKLLRGHICQDFMLSMSFELAYFDKEEVVGTMQRYSPTTVFTVPPKSILLRQWHHDGCNHYILRPVKDGFNQDGRESFVKWCMEHTSDLELDGII